MKAYLLHIFTVLSIITVLALLCINNAYADSVIIEMSEELKRELKPLGNNVVGRALPSKVIDNPHLYLASIPGKYSFLLLSENREGERTATEIQSEFRIEKGRHMWTRTIGENMIEDWLEGKDGSIHLTAETDTKLGYRVELKSHMMLKPGLYPGQRWMSESLLEAYDTESPDRVAYTGTLQATRVYEGSYEVKTPAGIFDTILLSEKYLIKLGSVKIEDRRLGFYTPYIGKVAEVDGIHASAFLIIHKRKKDAKVLTSYPRIKIPIADYVAATSE